MEYIHDEESLQQNLASQKAEQRHQLFRVDREVEGERRLDGVGGEAVRHERPLEPHQHRQLEAKLHSQSLPRFL